MNFNKTDGFNERNNYIHNHNDINRLKKAKVHHYDNSLSKMRIGDENKPNIKSANSTIMNDINYMQKNFLYSNSNKTLMNDSFIKNKFKNY